MSDSDDGAFQSADEGETVAQHKDESNTSISQETVTEKQTTKTKTDPGGAEQPGKHVKEKPADNKNKLLNEEDEVMAAGSRQTARKQSSTEETAKKESYSTATRTKQTRETNVEDRDTATGVTKEGRGKTKKGRRTKAREASGIKTKEGGKIKAEEGSEIKGKEGSKIKAEEGNDIKGKEGSKIKAEEDSEIKGKDGSKIKAEEDIEIKSKEVSEIKGKEADATTKEGSEMKEKEGSRVKTTEDSEIATKELSDAITDQDSKATTIQSSKAETTECSEAETTECNKAETTECSRADTTEVINTDSQAEKKTQPDGETQAESIHGEGSPKATRRVERRQPPAVEEAQPKKSSGWAWGGWGSSIMSAATQSVTSLTSTVGEGFSTVMETVEMSLGAVSPEELAEMSGKKKEGATELQEMIGKMKDGPTDNTIERTNAGDKQVKGEKDTDGSTVVTKQLDHTLTGDEKWEQGATPGGEQEAGDKAEEKKDEEEDISLTALLGELGSAASVATKWGFSGFSNVRSAMKTTGMTIVTGGLDVLETIGKTTYDVLAEGDTGLKAIVMNARDKPDLSKTLREAKDVAEVKAKENEEFEEARKAHFGAQFDEFQGLVQLEALESLSAECNSGVQTLLNTMPRLNLEDMKPQLVAIKEAFHLKDIDSDEEDEKEQDFGELVMEHASALGVNVSVEKLLQVDESIKKWLAAYQESEDKRSIRQGKEIHQKAIQSLAEFTATTVAFFHRSGQLLLMDSTIPDTMYKKIAANLASLTRVSCTEVVILSSMFTQCLNTALASTENAAVVINPLITDVYLEASNSSTYIQDAFQLLLPILQKAAIQVSMPRLRTLSGSS